VTSVEVLFKITLEFPSQKNTGDCNFMRCVGECCTEQLKCVGECCTERLKCVGECCTEQLKCVGECCTEQLKCVGECCTEQLKCVGGYCTEQLKSTIKVSANLYFTAAHSLPCQLTPLG
jgi:hypothetical protein